MRVFAIIVGLIVIVGVLLDAFETVLLPRRIKRALRFSSFFYHSTWVPYVRLIRNIQSPRRQENLLGYFGPLSLLFLLGLWAIGLIFGFALLQYGAGGHVQLGNETITFSQLIYHSGETFFTLGYGDITPTSGMARFLAVLEAGMGFGFLGTVIGYLPTIYSAFSKREIEISLLDARAGSPPTALELLGRFATCTTQEPLDLILRDWERWSAEVLESHISYPALSFFRSQHSNQSWLGALTTILDASSLLIAGVDGLRKDQAKITFAIARHAIVDLAQVVKAKYDLNAHDRLPAEELLYLREALRCRGLQFREGAESEAKLAHLRSLYEPYAIAMAKNLFITLPPWVHHEKLKDNWQSGPWDRAIQARASASEPVPVIDEHF